MTGYIIKVGKKGELYTPKKLLKRKTIIDLLDENAIASVGEEEIKKERRVLEKELMER